MGEDSSLHLPLRQDGSASGNCFPLTCEDSSLHLPLRQGGSGSGNCFPLTCEDSSLHLPLRQGGSGSGNCFSLTCEDSSLRQCCSTFALVDIYKWIGMTHSLTCALWLGM